MGTVGTGRVPAALLDGHVAFSSHLHHRTRCSRQTPRPKIEPRLTRSLEFVMSINAKSRAADVIQATRLSTECRYYAANVDPWLSGPRSPGVWLFLNGPFSREGIRPQVPSRERGRQSMCSCSPLHPSIESESFANRQGFLAFPAPAAFPSLVPWKSGITNRGAHLSTCSRSGFTVAGQQRIFTAFPPPVRPPTLYS
jgi:hypothetical protein